MNRVKKIASFMMVLVIVLSIFSGCSSGKKKDENSLRFLDVSPSPARQAYYEDAFAAFKAETGISVVYESVPWDEAANKIAVMGAAKELPDVMTTWAGWLGQYTDSEWVIPIDKYVDPTADQYTDVVREIIWPSEKELYGATYTVPDGVMVKGVFVRKDWAEELGIELDPEKGWTYEEYFGLVEKFTDPAQKRYGTSFRGARGAFDPLLVYLEGFNGGRIYDDEGNVMFLNDTGVQAMEQWCEPFFEGWAPKDSVNWGFAEMVDNFTGGLTGTLINDSEVAITCAENMEEGTWMVMPMPKSVDGKIYNTVNSPYSYSISSHSSNPDNSWKLIEFLSRPENNIEYCKMGGLIPVQKDVEDDPTYGNDGIYKAFVKQLNNPDLVVPVAFGPFDFTDMHQGMLHEELQQYLLGAQDAKTSLYNVGEELELRMKKYLEENPGSQVEKPHAMG